MAIDKPSLDRVLLNRDQEKKERLLHLRVRIKGFITNLIENTTADDIPVPLLIFIKNLTSPGQFVPDGFLTRYQINRIDSDNYGAIIVLDELQIKMISGIYIYARIMCCDYFLKFKRNTNQGEGLVTEELEENFKFIAAILYYIFM